MITPEYTMQYWAENFRSDVESFGKFWSTHSAARPEEFPERLTLQEWDEQFIEWLNRETARQAAERNKL